MESNSVQEIERAIGSLTQRELEELYGWLDQRPHPFDARLESDLHSGRLDAAILRALDDENTDQVRPL